MGPERSVNSPPRPEAAVAVTLEVPNLSALGGRLMRTAGDSGGF